MYAFDFHNEVVEQAKCLSNIRMHFVIMFPFSSLKCVLRKSGTGSSIYLSYKLKGCINETHGVNLGR